MGLIILVIGVWQDLTHHAPGWVHGLFQTNFRKISLASQNLIDLITTFFKIDPLPFIFSFFSEP